MDFTCCTSLQLKRSRFPLNNAEYVIVKIIFEFNTYINL